MSGRRENFAADRMRNSAARKRTHKEHEARQKQQATVFQRLWAQAKAEAKGEQESA